MQDKKLINAFSENQKAMEVVANKIAEATSKHQKELKKLQEKDTELRETIKNAMEENDIKKLENKFFTITYVAEGTRTGLDTKKLKEEAPGIYDKYQKTSQVKSHIKIKAAPNE